MFVIRPVFGQIRNKIFGTFLDTFSLQKSQAGTTSRYLANGLCDQTCIQRTVATTKKTHSHNEQQCTNYQLSADSEVRQKIHAM